MIVKYDEENFCIKLYRNFVKGELVELMEVIPIDELLEVWEQHKADTPQTEQTDCLTCRYNSDEWDSPKCDSCSKAHSNYEPQTDCGWGEAK